MNYLVKMQLKPSKAILVLRHRAAPHNMFGQAAPTARIEVAMNCQLPSKPRFAEKAG